MAHRATKFELYEKVVIRSRKPALAAVNGQLAAVLGKSIDDDGTCHGYTVHVYATGECWSVKEANLETTREFDKRDSFYSGSSIRVNQDGDFTE